MFRASDTLCNYVALSCINVYVYKSQAYAYRLITVMIFGITHAKNTSKLTSFKTIYFTTSLLLYQIDSYIVYVSFCEVSFVYFRRCNSAESGVILN